ncbi:MAG: hypothetical protein M1267_04900 [Candidatus Thermoplasmatota archaeon]|nr:hypothetical protein [Candidatus Thermoplasmatota archaeon]MCL5799835.1 hypothetical protein [Candidatus Thermoplasmatota archaeon]
MRNIRIVEYIESSYKVKTILLVSFVITFAINDQYLSRYGISIFYNRFAAFFQATDTLSVYANMIGLLLASYAVLVALIPNFTGESLKMPIFSQVNRLFVFTILTGIMLMILDFAQGIIPENGVFSFQGVPFFLDVQIFFFISLLSGMIFCVLTISEVFEIIRSRGEKYKPPAKRNSRELQ